MAKLTLSVDEKVIKQAKRIAAQGGTSVSAMFTQFVQSLARGQDSSAELGPVTRRATGLAAMPEGKTYPQILADALIDKHA